MKNKGITLIEIIAIIFFVIFGFVVIPLLCKKEDIPVSERYLKEFARLGIKGSDNPDVLIEAFCKLERRVHNLEMILDGKQK